MWYTCNRPEPVWVAILGALISRILVPMKHMRAIKTIRAIPSAAIISFLISFQLTAALAQAAPSCPAVFKVDSTQRNYANSVKYCASQGMVIASIHSQTENDNVGKLLRNRGIRVSYIGATDTATNGIWTWADGTPWDYTSPKNDGMDSQGEDHLAITSEGKWDDWGTGGSLLGVVCRQACGKQPTHDSPYAQPSLARHI